MGAKCLLLWSSPAAGGQAAAAPLSSSAPRPPPPPDAYEAACTAAARATGGPPTGTWAARIQMLRSEGGKASIDAVAVSVPPPPADHPLNPKRRAGPPPAPTLPASAPSPLTHVVLPAARRVVAGGPGLVPLLMKTGGFARRGAALEVGGLTFGAAGSAVVRVGRVSAGGGGAALRGIVLEVELADAEELAEAAPALAELTARVRAAAGPGVSLAPVPVPVSEFGLPAGCWGSPAHGAVQLAALAGAVLDKMQEVDCTAAGAADAIAAALARGQSATLRGLGRREGQAWPPAEWGAHPAALLAAAGGPNAADAAVVTCMASDEVDDATGVALFRGDAGSASEVSRRLSALLVAGSGGSGAGGRAPPTGSPARAVYLAQAALHGGGEGGRSDPASLALAALPSPPPPLLAAALERASASAAPPTLWLDPGAGTAGGARGGCVTSVHHDDAAAVLVVLGGAKTVRLVPPGRGAVAAGVRARPPWGDSPHHAAPGADLGTRPPPIPSLPLHEGAAGAVLETTLQAGDALFIPGGWWHQVGSAPGTAALSYALDGGRGGGGGCLRPSAAVALRVAARGVVDDAATAALAGGVPGAWWVGGDGAEVGGRKRAPPDGDSGGEEDAALAQDDAARLLRSPLAGGARATPAAGEEAPPHDPLGLGAPVTRALGALPSASAVRAALLAAARACPAALAARLGGSAPGTAPPSTPPLPPAAAALVACALDTASAAFLARLAASLGGAPKAAPAMAGLMRGRDAFAAGVGRPALLSVLGLDTV